VNIKGTFNINLGSFNIKWLLPSTLRLLFYYMLFSHIMHNNLVIVE